MKELGIVSEDTEIADEMAISIQNAVMARDAATGEVQPNE